MFKKSSQTKAKPQSPITPGSEGVGGDMARDAYEMTSPRRVLYYALRVAKYIPPTVALPYRLLALTV